jgi:hypothetical protein
LIADLKNKNEAWRRDMKAHPKSPKIKQVVAIVFKEFMKPRRKKEFEQAMREMALDPAIRRENARIAEEFKGIEKYF